MPAPFYNAIKGTTAGTPSTGAFTPNAASAGFRAWSTIPTGWIGLVRYEDGSAWELAYSYWNGTTLSRASTQVYDSSTGSQLTLTSSATAAMIVDASDVMSHIGGTSWSYWKSNTGGKTIATVGMAAPTTTGTAAGVSVVGGTNYLTQQQRVQITSATTANGQAGLSGATALMVVNTTAGLGGWEMTVRFGATVLPTGPRLFVGATTVTYVANTSEPSALVANSAAFTLDSTGDTNIQFTTNSGAGGGTKIDTGIALATGGAWYEGTIWCEPGSNKMWALLIRMDTGAIFLTSTTTDVPATTSILFPQVLCGLNGTNTGTAAVFHIGAVVVRNGE